MSQKLPIKGVTRAKNLPKLNEDFIKEYDDIVIRDILLE